MIFITVGTHEQGFDRLLKEIDFLIEKGVIKEKVFAQTGYSKYKPNNYEYKDMIGYDDMDEYVKKSNIVITHGGPASIFHPIQYGKTPIVVPRNPEFNEHVDDHQILFTRKMENDSRVIGVYDIKELRYKLENYLELHNRCNSDISNVKKFISKFEKLIDERLDMK